MNLPSELDRPIRKLFNELRINPYNTSSDAPISYLVRESDTSFNCADLVSWYIAKYTSSYFKSSDLWRISTNIDTIPLLPPNVGMFEYVAFYTNSPIEANKLSVRPKHFALVIDNSEALSKFGEQGLARHGITNSEIMKTYCFNLANKVIYKPVFVKVEDIVKSVRLMQEEQL